MPLHGSNLHVLSPRLLSLLRIDDHDHDYDHATLFPARMGNQRRKKKDIDTGLSSALPPKAFIQPAFTDPKDLLELRTRRRAYSKPEGSTAAPTPTSSFPATPTRSPTPATPTAPSKDLAGRFNLSTFSVPSNSGPTRPLQPPLPAPSAPTAPGSAFPQRFPPLPSAVAPTTPQRQFATLVTKARDDRAHRLQEGFTIRDLPPDWQRRDDLTQHRSPSPTSSDFGTDSTLEALAVRLAGHPLSPMASTTGPTAGPAPRDLPRARSPDSTSHTPATPYTSAEDYIRDAAILVETWDAAGGSAPSSVSNLFRATDYAAAKAALQMLPRRARDRFLATAQQQVEGAYGPAKFPDLFRRMLDRFRQGPPDTDDDEDEHPRPPPSNRTPEIPRTFSPPGHQGYTAQGNRESRSSAPPRHQSTDHAAAGLKAFQPKHISFNGTLPVTTYINRLRRMARCYSEKAVLTNLPLAMEGEAGEWMDGLPESLLQDMDDSLETWIDQLHLRFSPDISEVLATADALRHSFATEASLPVRQYLSKKIQLYREAGETSEDTMVRRMHRDLDPELARDVRLRDTDNTLADFQATVIRQSASSYRAWTQSQTSMMTLINARFATRQTPARDRYDRPNAPLSHPRSSQTTTRAISMTDDLLGTPAFPRRLLTEAATTSAQVDLPNLARRPRAPEDALATMAARRTTRPRYPCTHCSSTEHIDPDCPRHPRRAAAAARTPTTERTTATPAVRAYYTMADHVQEDLMDFPDDGTHSQDDTRFPLDPPEETENCPAGQ